MNPRFLPSRIIVLLIAILEIFELILNYIFILISYYLCNSNIYIRLIL